MDYQNMTCQVCQKEFQKGDDIVVCPECGTPVHRECWKQLSHCVNEYRHGTGWSFEIPSAAKEPEVETVKTESGPALDEGSDVESDPNSFTPYGNGQMGQYGGYAYRSVGADGQMRQGWHNIGADEPIGDFTAKDYASVVQKNSQSYIPKFMRMSKTGAKNSWNWAAFFFAPFWFVYRKMYGWAVLALVLSIIVPCCFASKVVNYAKQANSVYSSVLMAQSGETQEEAEKAANSVQSDMPDPPMALQVNEYVIFAVQILAGIFANVLYKRHCEKLLIRAKQSAGGAEREKFLRQRGGTSGLALVLFMFLSYALVECVLNIALKTNSDLATVVWRLFHK